MRPHTLDLLQCLAVARREFSDEFQRTVMADAVRRQLSIACQFEPRRAQSLESREHFRIKLFFVNVILLRPGIRAQRPRVCPRSARGLLSRSRERLGSRSINGAGGGCSPFITATPDGVSSSTGRKFRSGSRCRARSCFDQPMQHRDDALHGVDSQQSEDAELIETPSRGLLVRRPG